MIVQTAWQGTFTFLEQLPIVVEPSQAQLSSDAGLLPIRQFDEKVGLTRRFAAALDDPRQPLLVEHSVAEMTRSRIYGIIADYEDQNDHDVLRADPIFKILAGRSPDDDDLASQPTLSRFENSINIPSLVRLRDLFIDEFIASFQTPPTRITLDLDAIDDPVHGAQQLALFHGYFGQYQYFPAFITCAENDLFVTVSLRPGMVPASLGVDDDLRHLVPRLRQAFPGVRIVVRGDAGYGVPTMYNACEELLIEYTFGIGANNVLKARSDQLLQQAVAAFERTQTPQRLFDAFWYQAGSWAQARWVIVKAEANSLGTNRRFVVSNRPGARIVFEPAYDDYALRGESENRNKEIKCDLAMDRMSDHRFLANYFRLYLHAAAMNLLVRLRRAIVLPTPAPAADVPVSALAGEQRQAFFRARRRRDPLGEGHPGTWRSLLIKVAAEVITSTRRIVVRLSSTWPHLHRYAELLRQLGHLIVPATSPSG
jgi:hypothetical protein